MYLEMIDKVNLYVKQSGQGIPCIFVHGGPGEGSLDFEVLGGNALEGFMNMIYFDQRGSARSEGDEETDYSIDRLVEDMEEIRMKLGISKWIVMAHSFGGIIATNYAHKYGEFIDKLVLLNVSLSMKDSFKSQIYYGAKLLSEYELKTIDAKSDMEKWQQIVTILIKKDIFYKLQYEEYDNFIKLREVSNTIDSFNATMANQGLSNKEYFKSCFDLTKKITVPVLVVTGDEDYAVGLDHHKNFMFPNMKTKILSGKHMLYMENKMEIKSVIETFVKS
ncbi:alpha/beta hydrolase [uncultured Clostridium sp.]|uniref:alpha/beta fold hydrolase n=1 Tax=uncultured Clostridium sp. TaxID=59620 RepID=UPI0032177DF2